MTYNFTTTTKALYAHLNRRSGDRHEHGHGGRRAPGA
jgi:hypothetical protein